MLSTLRNAWKVPELKKRIVFTVFMVVLIRLFAHITVPGVDTSALADQIAKSNSSLISIYDLFSGGAFSQLSIIALSVTPYINASIIFSLLTVAIPALENMQKEGAEGRKKIQNYTRYASIIFAIVMSVGTIGLISRYNVIRDNSWSTYFVIVITLVTGSLLLVWLGEQITAHGLGNGVSLIIFANILSRLPKQTFGLYSSEADPVVITLYLAVLVGLLLCVVITNMAERRIPVQYAGKAVGGKVTRGQSSHIPININGSAVIAIIFAMSVMGFLPTVTQFVGSDSAFAKWITQNTWSPFNTKSFIYPIVMFALVIFFCWFYTELQLKPDEMAENMHKSSGFVPGIRPGEPTRKYLETIIGRISIIGGCFAGVIAIFPVIVAMVPGLEAARFGGTSLLIMTGVALETMKLLESQLVMRHYRGFLK